MIIVLVFSCLQFAYQLKYYCL